MKRPLSFRVRFNDTPIDGDPTGSGPTSTEVAADTTEDATDTGATDTGSGDTPTPTATDAGAPTPKTFDEDYVKGLRAEAAKYRTSAKTAADDATKALTQSLGKALGLIQDDEPADPTELTKQIEAERNTARAAQVELAVFRTAGKHAADADALLDSRSFLTRVKELDPTAPDFASQVEDAIKTVVENNPKLRVAQAAAKAGSDLSAGNADPSKGQLTREQLAALSPSDRLKAVKEGRVRTLLGGK